MWLPGQNAIRGQKRRLFCGWLTAMPRIESIAVVPLGVADTFALSQTYGALRYRWDPFVRKQHLLNGATKAGPGVQTYTQSRHWISMVSEYQAFKPPFHVGMKMVKGPWFFASLSGGWHFTELTPTMTKAVWRYNFVCRPTWLQPISHRIGSWLLQKDIDQRLAAFAKACADPTITSQIDAFQMD
jgi:ribosome-associated toxin RatA of RatAB toxin-antitoxin module